jgi:RNA polymerase sigma-70 factor (ECF subfamily)
LCFTAKKIKKAHGLQSHAKGCTMFLYRIVRLHFAEDVMQEGFKSIQINDYKKEVVFGALVKRIIVNCSIDFIKNNQFKPEDFDTTLYKLKRMIPIQ